MASWTQGSAISEVAEVRLRSQSNVGSWANAAAIGLLVLVVVSVLLAPQLAPYDPLHFDAAMRLQAPSRIHWLGTDELGRDLLSRMLFGGRITLSVGIGAVILASVLGSTLGLLAGFFGGIVDRLVMRLFDVWMALPTILLVLAIITAVGPSLMNTMVAIAVSLVPAYARIARGAALSTKQDDYIKAARLLGAGSFWIIGRHMIPNIFAPILIYSALAVTTAILLTSGLSFIGLGPPPPTPEWGALLASARTQIHRAWWLVTFPGVAISVTILTLNLAGDALRDRLDPRHRLGQ